MKRENVSALNLRLKDALLDLDQPVIVRVNMEEKFRGKAERTVEAIWNWRSTLGLIGFCRRLRSAAGRKPVSH